MSKDGAKGLLPRTRNNLFAGILVVIPLWITWLVFEFLFKQLASIGTPWVRMAARALSQSSPTLSEWMLQPWFQNSIAVVMMIVGLYLLGWLASWVIGQRLIGVFDSIMRRIPLVKKIYGSTQQLLSVLRQEPESAQRVVLIEFPSPGMYAVGFVTRTLTDQSTGKEFAAVYVPTTPNPTSGYLELVPIENVVSTDWSMDEAMTFIISGGAVAPKELRTMAAPTASGEE
ncbi:MAG: DUF502 domain-containing protein [Proteobacteria bacterium]|nr:MAG: DUF502 domain-containing protein [Pseudomonadota bacterium]QKK11615.1 MAG: DUF502 domain-containing protein [Pseudomonadota bacterium]